MALQQPPLTIGGVQFDEALSSLETSEDESSSASLPHLVLYRMSI